jgi:hypothetical protein
MVCYSLFSCDTVNVVTRIVLISGQHQHSSDRDLIASTGEEGGTPFYMDTQVVLPAAISAVAVLAALTAVGFCLHRRKQNFFFMTFILEQPILTMQVKSLWNCTSISTCFVMVWCLLSELSWHTQSSHSLNVHHRNANRHQCVTEYDLTFN